MPFASFPPLPAGGTYTPIFTGFGTVVSPYFTYALVAPKLLLIQGKFTTGTATAVEAQVTLPTGYTTPAAIPTITGVGVWTGFGAVSGSQVTILAEPSKTYLTFGLQDSSHAGLTKQTGTALIGSAATMSFVALVPIA